MSAAEIVRDSLLRFGEHGGYSEQAVGEALAALAEMERREQRLQEQLDGAQKEEAGRMVTEAMIKAGRCCKPPPLIGVTRPQHPDWMCGYCGRIWRDNCLFNSWSEVRGPTVVASTAEETGE